MLYIAERHIHDSEHDFLSYEEAIEHIENDKLRMKCGSITQFTVRYLKERGIKARFVLTLTADTWNTYNNGHSMVEVYEDGKWRLWDIDRKCYFIWEGEQVNAKTFCEVRDMPYEIVEFGIMENVEGDLWFASITATEEGKRWFYSRVCQVPMIKKGEFFYFTCAPALKNRIRSYPYTGPFSYLPERQFVEEFYRAGQD